ncbi:RDD family protein [Rhizobium bangladeshense]|uniref:RDD family protein n=1 Tax=Rhizobium bangladeshense TaxID=1138189 RepID=UPI0007E568FA|nr:RDD family protein [Rhizobium bangladeshense]
MAYTTEMPQPVTLPPRYFWRRLEAFTIDFIIFQAVILIIVSHISAAFHLDFRFPGWTSTWCGVTVPDQLAQRIDAGWPLRGNESRETSICEVTQIALGKQRYLQTGAAEDTEHWVWSGMPTFPLDAHNNPVTTPLPAYPILMSGVANTVLVAGAFAYFSANGRRTLGKSLAGLKVQSVDGQNPGIGITFKREFLKFSPSLFFSVTVFVLSLFPLLPTEDFDTLLRMMRDGYTIPDDGGTGYYVMLTVAAMAWWLLPFVAWQGQVFYDRICACKVVSPLEASRPVEADPRQNRPRIYRRLAPIRGSRRRRRRAYLRAPH